MGWFWESWTSSTPSSDPTKSLDSNLKTFLEESKPAPYEPVSQQQQPQPPPQPIPEKATPDPNAPRPLPAESLFRDGRYAHLWKTYRSVAELDAENGSVQHPTTVIYEQFKDRKELLNNAAMENCAIEAERATRCFEFGTWQERLWARATMCKDANRKFNRCYIQQSKFLQALGYMSDPNTNDETHEAIQMHADTLYHRMLEYEKRVAAAKKEELPEPPLTSMFDPKVQIDPERLEVPRHIEKQLKQPLKELPPWEREVAVRAAEGELAFKKKLADMYRPIVDEELVKKGKRREWIQGVVGDKVGKWIVPEVALEREKKDEDAA